MIGAKSLKTIFILFVSSIFLSGCLAYQSEGRKVFEARAPGSINTSSNNLWCWTASEEQLHWTNLERNLIVTQKDDGRIEYCSLEHNEQQ